LFAVFLKSCLLFCEGLKRQTAVFLEKESFFNLKVSKRLIKAKDCSSQPVVILLAILR